MAVTPSNMLPLGTVAPAFTLPDTVSGKIVSLDELKSNTATVIMFICNHCPFVKHLQNHLSHFAKEYRARGISFIAINANDAIEYPEDAPERMKQIAKQFDYSFPYLYDESQAVAKAYQAACTPDFYIFDKGLRCVYRGQYDDSRPGNNAAITGKDLGTALDNILQGKPIASNQKPSMGCNIKWK
jgi:thiol-disulfide isomerase/thioredoxin